MKFVCELCHTKYAISDEKVRGKVLKVRCKTCANVITVRETGASVESPTAAPPGAGPARASQSGGFDVHLAPTAAARITHDVLDVAESAPSGRVSAPSLFAPAPVAPPAAPGRVTRPSAPATAVVDDGIEWFMAVEGSQTGPFPRPKLVEKLRELGADADVHVWNARFDSWKPPLEVPELKADLAAPRPRRAPTPAAPPPAPGARRSSGAMPVASSGRATRPSGAHALSTRATDGAVVANPVSAEVARSRPELRTSGAMAHRTTSPRNGIATAAAFAESAGDALTELDLPAGPVAPGAPEGRRSPTRPSGPSLTLAAGPSGAALPAPAGFPAEASPILSPPLGTRLAKGRPFKLMLGALGVVVVVCGVVAYSVLRRPSPPPAVAEVAPEKPAAPDFAGLAAKIAAEEPVAQPAQPAAPSAPAVVPVAPPEPARTSGRSGKRNARASKGAASPATPTAPPPLSPTAPPALSAEQQAAVSRFAEPSQRQLQLTTGSGSGGPRSTPAQADISRVINANRQGIQTCYQRALLRDNSLVRGKITVRVSIGISGKVKKVSLDAPAQFRTLEPCIREVMSRWAFPPSSEEYGTEFPVVLQGS